VATVLATSLVLALELSTQRANVGQPGGMATWAQFDLPTTSVSRRKGSGETPQQVPASTSHRKRPDQDRLPKDGHKRQTIPAYHRSSTTNPKHAQHSPVMPVAGEITAPSEASVTIEKRMIPLTNQEHARQAWQEGMRQISDGDRDGAIERFRHALVLQPNHIDARWYLAATLINEGHTDEAGALLSEGMEITHYAPRLSRLYAHLLLNQNDPHKAAEVLVTSPPALEKDAEYHALLASALVRSGRPALAAGIYERLLTRHPENGVWWVGLAYCREAMGAPEDALTAYQRAATTRLAANLGDIVHQRVAVLKTAVSKGANQQPDGTQP